MELDPAVAPPGADEIFRMALGFASAGRYSETIATFRRVIGLNPGELSARNNKGLVLSRLGRKEEAMICFDHARTLHRGRIR